MYKLASQHRRLRRPAPSGAGRFDFSAGVEDEGSATPIQPPSLRSVPVSAPLPPPSSTPAEKSKRSGDFDAEQYINMRCRRTRRRSKPRLSARLAS